MQENQKKKLRHSIEEFLKVCLSKSENSHITLKRKQIEHNESTVDQIAN